MVEESKRAKRTVTAPTTASHMSGGQVLSVEVGPDQDVQWIWTHDRERGSHVTGYKIVAAAKVSHVTVNPNQMGGVPCIRALRIPVATVVGSLADGMSEAEILEAFPDLTADDIREALRFAAEVIGELRLTSS